MQALSNRPYARHTLVDLVAFPLVLATLSTCVAASLAYEFLVPEYLRWKPIIENNWRRPKKLFEEILEELSDLNHKKRWAKFNTPFKHHFPAEILLYGIFHALVYQHVRHGATPRLSQLYTYGRPPTSVDVYIERRKSLAMMQSISRSVHLWARRQLYEHVYADAARDFDRFVEAITTEGEVEARDVQVEDELVEVPFAAELVRSIIIWERSEHRNLNDRHFRNVIARCHNLEKLALHLTSPHDFSPLTEAHKLESLCLESAKVFFGDRSSPSAPSSVDFVFPALRELQLVRIDFVDTDSLEKLFCRTMLPNLVALTITQSPRVLAAHVSGLTRLAPQLRLISFDTIIPELEDFHHLFLLNITPERRPGPGPLGDRSVEQLSSRIFSGPKRLCLDYRGRSREHPFESSNDIFPPDTWIILTCLIETVNHVRTPFAENLETIILRGKTCLRTEERERHDWDEFFDAVRRHRIRVVIQDDWDAEVFGPLRVFESTFDREAWRDWEEDERRLA